MLSLKSKLRRDLLAYFFTNPKNTHHLREIAELLRADPANLSRELARLEGEAIFVSRKVGNQKHFNLNRAHPLYGELRGIVFKTVGVVGQLRGFLARVSGIEEAYLYGSFARNHEDPLSDIDLLLIGQPRASELEDAIRKLERRLRREVNYVAMSREELGEKLERRNGFIEQVWQDPKIRLIPPPGAGDR
jgi:predicted nucleotidyltransferase